MISESPSLVAWSLSEPEPTGIESFLERYAAHVTFYGSGKAALYDGLAGFVEPDSNVLLPAYLPDAVAEPFHELGLEPRYYRLQSDLSPDLADVERRLDDETAAAVSVDYFGFPQPGFDSFSALVSEYDCYLIDDNAHAPLSVADGMLLGTRGDLGVTSLWKLLPIPDGAILYCNDETVAERFEPSSIAGVRDQLGTTDCRFALKSFVAELLDRNATLRQSVDELVAGRGPSVPDPRARYESGKTQMSKLSAYVIEDADPTAIRDARRENYRTWLAILEDCPDVDACYDSLPAGICPQVVPVRANDPQRFLADLEDCGVGAHTWPRLSETVVADPGYEVTKRLAREIVVLPVHQHIEPSSIESVGARLRR
ncbi:DegT/DnrJ/EryC1/StrS family aminotransferase [Natronolimnohabitans innermongolicus]|uniref:DegT/DnrJ/EryC1/StrS aminotransferase n=1 Tax=Natronolimnohabitans innermongolicus JCM 12255 TaxID=1227499 RepID=L9WGK3_9EURY|nr:DegT/DnrJ/EryC1/StrS family aminotransferase [Natronolimnohabitans innermongolicus]ELY48574.1 DegT/DnrJ/EryC1/StrS aminotransferase [Natronolimnohabitans innermongolicus JCM 12255]